MRDFFCKTYIKITTNYNGRYEKACFRHESHYFENNTTQAEPRPSNWPMLVSISSELDGAK